MLNIAIDNTSSCPETIGTNLLLKSTDNRAIKPFFLYHKFALNMYPTHYMYETIPEAPYDTGMTWHDAPCECQICSQQYRTRNDQVGRRLNLRYRREISNVDAKTMLDELGESINGNRQYLRDQLSLYGPAIAKKWNGMKREKRGQWLLEIDKEMFTKKWAPIIHSFDHAPSVHTQLSMDSVDEAASTLFEEYREHPNAKIAPDISIDLLKSEPAKGLAMLHQRAKHSPTEWFAHDFQATKSACELGSCELSYNRNCIDISSARYPRLVKWNREAIHEGLVVGWPGGILAVRSQEYRLRLLKGVVTKMVAGFTTEPGSYDIGTQSPEFSLGRNSLGILPSLFLNRLYTAPSILDLDELLSTTISRMDYAHNQLTLLQTDAEYLKIFVSHVTNTKLCKVYSKEKNSQRHDYAIAIAEIRYNFEIYGMWKGLVEEIKKVKSMPATTSTKAFSAALVPLQALIVHEIDRQKRHLLHSLGQRPTFMNFFAWFSPRPAVSYMDGINWEHFGAAKAMETVFKQEPIFFCLQQLTLPLNDKNTVAPAVLLSYLEKYLAESSRTERARIDPLLDSKISDLAALLEMHELLGYHTPMVTRVDTMSIRDGQTGRSWRYLAKNKSEESLVIVLKKDDKLHDALVSICTMARPSGVRNESWLAKAESNQVTLQMFWTLFRDDHKSVLIKHHFSEADIASDCQDLSAHQSPEHLRTLAKEKAFILAKIAESKMPKAPLPTHQPQTEWGTKATLPTPEAGKKEKVKTRSDQPVGHDMAGLALEPAIPDLLPAKIAVSKQFLTTLQLILPKEYAAYKPMKWIRFIQAMTAIGFVGIQGDGSRVKFVRLPNEMSPLQGRLHLHQPHGEPDIRIDVMTDIRHQLWNTFGWNSETFVLAEK